MQLNYLWENYCDKKYWDLINKNIVAGITAGYYFKYLNVKDIFFELLGLDPGASLFTPLGLAIYSRKKLKSKINGLSIDIS